MHFLKKKLFIVGIATLWGIRLRLLNFLLGFPGSFNLFSYFLFLQERTYWLASSMSIEGTDNLAKKCMLMIHGLLYFAETYKTVDFEHGYFLFI